MSLLRASPGRGRGQALGGEPPVYDGASIVALAFERGDLPSQQRFIADPAVQTLPAEDAELDFSHVQPASVIGCVVKLQAFGYAARLVHQPLHLFSEVHSSPAPGHLDVPPPTLRFTDWRSLCGQTGSEPLIGCNAGAFRQACYQRLRDRYLYRVLPLALGTCLGDVIGWTWEAPSTWRVPSSFRLAVAVFINPDIVAKAIVAGQCQSDHRDGSLYNQRYGRSLHKHGGPVGNVGHSLR